MSARVPSQEDLQRTHDERLAKIEAGLEEARKFIAVNAQQIALLRQWAGLPPTYEEGPTPT